MITITSNRLRRVICDELGPFNCILFLSTIKQNHDESHLPTPILHNIMVQVDSDLREFDYKWVL